jgi:NAD(P)-dependent dehydrogenase (short-subunit alcohol dehydrogenase family)
MRGLDGKVAIVTGGASGLGRAIARRMASEGARVAVADIDDDGAARVVAEITDQGGSARAVSVDVSDEAAVRRMVGSTVDTFGRLDALFNNAAALGNETVGHDGDLSQLDVDTWDRTLAINLRGVMLGCKYAAPHLVAAGGGAIVNTASTGAYQGTGARSAYGASKAGVIGFTRYVAAMYGADRVRCNAVVPAYMANPDTVERESADQRRMARYERILPDPATPDDVAAMAVFLVSDDARAATGQTYVVDAGRLARRSTDSIRAALGDVTA